MEMDAVISVLGIWMFGLGCVSGFFWSQGTQYRRFSKEYRKLRDEWQELGAEYKKMRELAVRLQHDDYTRPYLDKDNLH